jgi:hypothetical protein
MGNRSVVLKIVDEFQCGEITYSEAYSMLENESVEPWVIRSLLVAR